MEPREYEELVAKYYKSKGYETELNLIREIMGLT